MPSPVFDSLPALPTVPAPAAIRVRTNQRTKTSQSESGHILSRAYGGQFFEVTLTYNPMRRDQAAPLIAFLQSREGRNSIFKVELTGFAPATGLFTGNFANFDNDTKLHLITNEGTSAVTPDARVSGGSLVTDKVFMRASLRNDVQEISLGRGGLIRPEVDLIERL